MPLTEQETAIIKATVPLLETGGETLTKHFYATMLSTHPEVVPFFNKAHQASGDQPRALANAVLMYAKNIERLENLGPLVNRIINKHVSLDINLEHYSVVGSCLLQAIREVLGAEIATDDVIAAWASAYGQLVTILAGAEQAIYDSVAAAPGGWKGDREFVVKDKVKESDEITSFYMESADGKPIKAYEAGQYIGLHIFVNGDETRRQYSLSCASNDKHYRISVKREPGGVVSNHLHDNVQIGDKLTLYPPSGDFKLVESTKPIVFVTAGVGITPAIAMLEEVLRNEKFANRPIHFIHCARTRAVQAFHNYLTELAHKHFNLTYYNVYSRETVHSAVNFHSNSRITEEKLKEWLPADKDLEVYFLGAKEFMRDVKKYLLDLGVPAAQLHWEFFGPAKDIEEH